LLNISGTCLAQMAGVPLSTIPVAIVMTSFEPGGTERQMIELVRRLDTARWSVHVPCFHARGAWFGRVAEAAASVAEFPVESFRTPDALQQLWAFARWCRSLDIAIVHTTELYSNIFGLSGAALARVPVRIGNRREINPDKTTAQIAMQRAAYGVAHRIVANSHAAAERLALEHVPARKIAVVPNGLDVGQFQPRRRRTPLRRVVVVANLRREKGHDVLLDAAVDVLRHFPDAVFEFVGGGPERDVLDARARELNIAHAVTFAGHQEDVASRLAAGDLFVLPSRSEAFPNAVLEAMAAGLPIVASAVGGILELIDDGRTGLLTPAGDARALADRVIRLMSDATLGDRLGAAARADAQAHYSFDRMVAAFEDLYFSELSRSAKAWRSIAVTQGARRFSERELEHTTKCAG
jgi:glycosyltransferase involved in cell wall biosynthesis